MFAEAAKQQRTEVTLYLVVAVTSNSTVLRGSHGHAPIMQHESLQQLINQCTAENTDQVRAGGLSQSSERPQGHRGGFHCAAQGSAAQVQV